jgi:hypothetical protein
MKWDGRFVAKESWEPRNAQDFCRGLVDDQRVPIGRPRSTLKFLEVGDVTPEDL